VRHGSTRIYTDKAKIPWLRRPLVLVLVACLAASVSFGQSRRTPPVAPTLPNPAGEKGLVELERQLLEAIRERNTDKLNSILANDFVSISPRKRDLNRAEFINQTKSSASAIEWLGAEEMKIRMYGDVAVITGLQNSQVRPQKGALQSSDTPFTHVFRRRQGRWELVLAFSGEVPPAPAPKK
jgi:ketosteroid isomerase-like protein